MNSEFHYYVIYFLCLESGISDRDAYIIAYSSQYVDNNIVKHVVNLSDGLYETRVTQNYAWLGDWFPKNVYVPFHFIPGDYKQADERKDKRQSRHCVTPGSTNARELLKRAFKTKNLYRIGMALHTFADTWSHQNFTGFNEDFNCVKNNLMPDVGHAEVYSSPDKINYEWQDTRLVDPHVTNNERFFAGAREIYKVLCEYNETPAENLDSIIEKVSEIFGEEDDRRSPEERIYDCILKYDMMEYNKFEWMNNAVVMNDGYFSSEELNELDTLEWIKDAILYQSSFLKRPVLQPQEGFYDSDWFNWHEQVKNHLSDVKEILKGLI